MNLNFLPYLALATAGDAAASYGPLKKFFLFILEGLFQVTANLGFPNWVLTIFVFAMIIRVVMQPLMGKQMRSSRKMQMLSPEIEALKKKYPNDPQRVNAEQMRLYKEYDIKPMAGCLPMVVNMVLMIALYQVIRTYVPADTTYFHLPILGVDNLSMICSDLGGVRGWILPLVCGVTTFFSQWMISPNRQDSTQRTMLIIMPVMFVVMVHKFPVLVALYWLFYNLISTAIQYPLIKRWERLDRESIEKSRREREEKERLKNQKREAAKKAKQTKQSSATNKQQASEKPAEFDFFAEEDEEGNVIESQQLVYHWTDWKGWTVHRKKEKLHPFSEEEDVVETIITDSGEELTAAQAYNRFREEYNQALQKASGREQTSPLDKLSLFKKKQGEKARS